MRRILPLLLVLVLSLSACATAGEDTRRGVDTTRSFVHYLQDVQGAETADTIYFMGFGERYLKYADKATGISGILCGRPECGHTDTNCNAYVENLHALFVSDGRLYWVDRGRVSAIYSAALDGSDRVKVRELDRELVPNTTTNEYFMIHDGRIYMGCVGSTIENGEKVEFNYVGAFPLDPNEEPTVILKEETKHNNYLSMQPYGDKLYFFTDDLHGTLAEADEKGEYLYDLRLRCWDWQSGELELLYEEDASARMYLPSELWVTDDGVLFACFERELEEMRIYKYDFETGECGYQFSSGVPATVLMGIADGIVTGFNLTNNNGVYDLFVVIKDFEGNILVDETYEFDLREECPYHWTSGMDMLGQDETYAYYSANVGINKTVDSKTVLNSYVTIFAVALDGSGAKVLCTTLEER